MTSVDDLLAAKFDPPVWIGDQIRRAPLLERLRAALDNRLTLIHAPAGYGKTSLLAQWRDSLATSRVRTAWLSLERDDRDVKRLVRYLMLAIRGDEAEGAGGGPHPAELPPRAALSAILHELAACQLPFVLILDDLHHADSPQVTAFLQSMIRLAPAHCHFVFASRDYPSLGQSVLAAEAQFLEIDVTDLRFSEQEAETLLERAGRGLAAGDVDRILERTEGWPIAVKLTGLSLQRGVPQDEAMARFSGPSVELARYLSEQVLMTLPDETRDLVMQTAVLNRLTGELVNVLLERTDGGLLLERLEQQGVFLAPVTPNRDAYRYHQLFADCMRDRLLRVDRDLHAALQRRAARWFAEGGDIAEAVNHALQACDQALLAEILETAGGWRLIPQGQQGVVERGLAGLSKAAIAARPCLALAEVYLQIKTGELGLARASFDGFLAQGQDHLPAELQTEIQVVGDTLSDYENQPLRLEDLLAREALLRKLPANDHLVLANTSETVGAKYFEGGWLERALQPTLAARDHYQALGSLYSDLFTRFLESRIKRAQGRSIESAAILDEAWRQIVDNFGRQSDLAANCAAFQSVLLYELDQADEARALLAWALPHMERFDGWVDVYSAAYFTEARALAGAGALDEALDVVDRARRTALRRRLRQLELLADLCEIELLLMSEASLEVIHSRASAIGLDALADAMAEDSPGYRPVAVAAALCRGRLMLQEGLILEALAELGQLKRWAEAHGASRLLIDVNILLAHGQHELGDEAEARITFDQAVELAVFQGLSRPFIDAHAILQPLLDDAIAAGFGADRFREHFLKGLSRTLAATRTNRTLHGLSAAEGDVLYYLSQGHSNKEIARIIGMSPDTVKYRLKSVFRKIGVSRRRDAVRVSAERGLIPEPSLRTPPENDRLGDRTALSA